MVRERVSVSKTRGIRHIRRNAGRAESVIADPRLEADGARAALDHAVSVLLPHFLLLAGLAAGCAEKRAIGIAGDAGGRDVLVDIPLQIVVTRKFMLLATCFV